MTKIITVIGSRTITISEFNTLKDIVKYYSERGYIVRSGGAEGADYAATKAKRPQIYIPWEGFNYLYHDGKTIFSLPYLNNNKFAEEVVKKIHPAPSKLTSAAWKLHMRNVYQILGDRGDTVSSAVFFCADEDSKGNVSGGTRTAIEIARSLNIPTYNIRNQDFNWRDINEI